MVNLIQLFDQAFQYYADKTAIVIDEQRGRQRYQFQEIEREIKIRACWLQNQGLKKGDRVVLLLPKSLEFIFSHLATLFAGAISVPLNPDCSENELRYYLSDIESSLLITDAERWAKVQKISEEERGKVILLDDSSPEGWEPFFQELRRMTYKNPQVISFSPQDVALIIYTSGSTGKPKGAMITHQNIISNLRTLKEIWAWTEKDVLLHILPLFHIHGLVLNLWSPLLNGSTTILHEKFDPQKSWQDIEREKCTLLSAVPTIYNRLLKEWDRQKPDLQGMRLFLSGAAPLSAKLFFSFAEKTNFQILDRYGMTETGVIAANPLDPLKRIPLSVGYPLPGVKVRLATEDGEEVKAGEVGEVWVRGNNVFKGYWKRSEETKESFSQGWFKTGDLGYQDQEDYGRLYLVGRKKELINTGGFKVIPREVEAILETHEAIQEAAVLGIPDEDFGEKVVAFVGLKKEGKNLSPQDLINFCKKHLVSYKCPKEIIMLNHLPRNSMNKVVKAQLRERLLNKGLIS